MPDFSPEIRKAAERAIIIEAGDYGYDGTVSGSAADLANAVLDAVAADLGQVVAAKILAHCGSPPGAVAARRRHFATAARVAAGAFLTEDDKLRMAGEALAARNFVACENEEK